MSYLYDIGFYGDSSGVSPATPVHVGYGYDPESYISTAKLIPSPYVTQAQIISKIGGLNRLTEAVDDSQPPIGSLDPNNPPNNPAYLNYLQVIQTVVTEINGYLSDIYPIPLAQTGTVAILKVATVSDDGLGTITGLQIIDVGNYLDAPASPNSPAYLRHIDPQANAEWIGANWQECQQGTGLAVTVTFDKVNYSDESGQLLQANALDTVTISSGGTGYTQGQLLVLTGGSSFVPAKVRQAALDLICHLLYLRRFAPEEKNPFAPLAKMWRQLFQDIASGEKQLDGTYKRFYSAAQCWSQRSVIFPSNSL